jgi:hypothetical protein
MMSKIERYLGNISAVLKVNPGEITFSEDAMLEIIERVEKRRVYFHIFYNSCDMGELNEGALLCFWIAKLQPFHHPKISSSALNAKIALCLFMNAVYYVSEEAKTEKRIPPRLVDDLFYSLRYRDISKEALMILAEGLAKP